MYERKPITIKPQDLCILTKPKKGIVNMYQKDQPISSESIIEALEATINSIENIYMAFVNASNINRPINDIINDKDDTLFLGLDRMQDVIEEKIKNINNLPELYRLTKDELVSFQGEMDEPENQSPFGAGLPSLSDVMEDI